MFAFTRLTLKAAKGGQHKRRCFPMNYGSLPACVEKQDSNHPSRSSAHIRLLHHCVDVDNRPAVSLQEENEARDRARLEGRDGMQCDGQSYNLLHTSQSYNTFCRSIEAGEVDKAQ